MHGVWVWERCDTPTPGTHTPLSKLETTWWDYTARARIKQLGWVSSYSDWSFSNTWFFRCHTSVQALGTGEEPSSQPLKKPLRWLAAAP